MKFAGLVKHSLCDYPGKVSCVLFTSGCNFKCPYCHNPELATGSKPASIALEDVMAFLEARRGFLDAVVVSGGEPTLQPDLVATCLKLKAAGFAVKLDTNGSRPAVLDALVRRQAVDFVAMDVKTDPCRYHPMLWKRDAPGRILESLRLLLASSLASEFRTTCVPGLVDEAIIARIAEAISGTRRYVLQLGRPGHTLCPGFFERTSSPFTMDDLNRFQAIAAPWVEACLVR